MLKYDRIDSPGCAYINSGLYRQLNNCRHVGFYVKHMLYNVDNVPVTTMGS